MGSNFLHPLRKEITLKMKQLLSLCLLLFIGGEILAQACAVTGPIVIGSQGITEITFDVSGLVNDDLSTPGQSLCTVELGFTHNSVSTLEIEIISPAGQSVNLVGPGNVTSLGSTQFIQWDVVFAASNFPAIPDGTFNDRWDNANAWEAFNNYNGRYYPTQGALEDMDQGSANGIWTIRIEDLSLFGSGVLNRAAIQFCDITGGSCDVCYANAGFFDEVPTQVFCTNDPLLSDNSYFNVLSEGISFFNEGYSYAVVQNGEILSFENNIQLNVLPPGDYQLCGVIANVSAFDDLSMIPMLDDLIEVFDDGTYCGAVMERCLDIRIEDPGTTETKTETICPDEVITLDGLNFYQPVDTIVYTYTAGGCESAIRYIIDEMELEAQIIASNNVIGCNETLILNGNSSEGSISEYIWTTQSGNFVNNTGPIATIDAPGLYFLEVTSGACSSVTSYEVSPDGSFANTIVLQSDSLGCLNSVVTINAIIGGQYDSFTWDGPGITNPNELFPTVSQPGVYTITVNSASGGCPSVSNSIVIAQSNSAPTPLFNNLSPIDCNETAQIQVVNNINAAESAWLNSSGDTISNNPVAINITAPDTYTYNYIDVYGCAGSSSIEVEGSFEPLNIEIEVDSLSCNKFEGQIFTEVEGTYNNLFWIGPVSFVSTDPNPEIKYPGTYFIEVYAEDGCLTRDTVEIEYDQEAFNMKTTSPTISCSEREVDIVVIPGGPNFNYEWEKLNDASFTAPDADRVTVDQGGFYFVEITRPSDDCTVREVGKVITDTIPASLTFDLEKIDCDTDEIPIESNISAFGLLDFTWSGPDIDASNMEDAKPVVDLIGEYYIEGISGNGCEFMDTILVEDDFTPINLDPQNIFVLDCFDENASTLLTADREGNFVVTTPSGVVQDTINDDRIPLNITEVGSYTVDIIASNGCRDQLIVEVVYGQAPPEVELIGAIDLDCENPEVVVEAVLGGDWDNFVWMHNGNSVDQMVTITEPGEYLIDVTNAAGCSSQDTVTIDDNRRVVELSLMADTISCNNLMANISVDAMENISYEWSGPAGDLGTDDSIDVLEIDTYYVTVTGDDGCIGQDSIAIVADTTSLDFDILPIATIDCIDDVAAADIDLTSVDQDQVSQVNWVLDGVVESEGLNGELTQGGMYIVELIGDNGCVSEQMVEVIENKVFPLVTIEPDSINCLNDIFEVTAEAVANDPSYEWDGPDPDVSGLTDAMISGVESGTYTVTVTDDNNCSVIETVEIVGDFDIPSTFGEDLLLTCSDPSSSIILENYDAAIHTVTLTDPNGDTFNDAFDDITIPGEYSLEVMGENGCVSPTVFNVLGDLDAPAAVIDSSNINCIDTEGTLSVESIENIQSYEWITGEIGSQFIGDEDEVTTTVPGIYQVVITGFNGCVDTLTSNIEIDTVAPVVVLDQLGIIGCASVEATISSENSTGEFLAYSWTTSDGSIITGEEQIDLLVGGVGTYTLNLVNQINGCESQESITVIDEGNVLVNSMIDIMSPPCEGESFGQINIAGVEGGTGELNYSIDGGASFQDEGLFDGLPAGDYDVVIIDSIGCETTELITLDDGIAINLDLGQDTTIRLGETYTIMPESNYDPSEVMVTWETNYPDYDCFNCWDNEVSPLNTTVYTVTIVDDFNCTVTDKITVQVDETVPVFIANIVDFQGPIEEAMVLFNAGPGVQMVESWMILDRWGSIIHSVKDFVPNDIQYAWDGTSNGVDVLPGVYMYVADIVLVNGDQRTIAGDITVIR